MSNAKKKVEELGNREFIVFEGLDDFVQARDFRFGTRRDVKEVINDLVENQSDIETLITFHMDTRGYSVYQVAGKYNYTNILGALEIIKTKIIRKYHDGD